MADVSNTSEVFLSGLQLLVGLSGKSDVQVFFSLFFDHHLFAETLIQAPLPGKCV